MSTVNERRVDDRDATIRYGPGWQLGGRAENEYMGTTTGASVEGAFFTFNFNGTGIRVVGTVGLAGSSPIPVSRYTLDNSRPTDFAADRLPREQYDMVFFEELNLPYGRHALEAKHVAGGLWIDYLVVHGERDASGNDSSTGSGTTGTKSGAPIGVIVGGAVGGVALIAFILGLAVFLWKRKKKKNPSSNLPSSIPPQGYPPVSQTWQGHSGSVTSPGVNTVSTNASQYGPIPTLHGQQLSPFNIDSARAVSPPPQDIASLKKSMAESNAGPIASPVPHSTTFPPTHQSIGSLHYSTSTPSSYSHSQGVREGAESVRTFSPPPTYRA